MHMWRKHPGWIHPGWIVLILTVIGILILAIGMLIIRAKRSNSLKQEETFFTTNIENYIINSWVISVPSITEPISLLW